MIAYFGFVCFLGVLSYLIGTKIGGFDVEEYSDVGTKTNFIVITTLVGIIFVGITGHQIAGDRWELPAGVIGKNLPDPIVSIVTELPILLTITVGITGLLLGSWPRIARLSGSSIRRSQSITGSILIALVVFVFIGLGTELSPALGPRQIGVLSAGGLFLLTATVYRLLPRLLVIGRDPRAPTPDQRNQLDRIAGEAGIEFDEVLITEVDTFNGAVWIVGRPATKRLILVESLLDDANDEEIAIALAEADGRFHRYVIEYTGVSVLLLVSYILVVGTGIAPTMVDTVTLNVGSVVTITIAVGILHWKTKQSYYIDESLARQFGVDSLIETYRRHGETLFVDGWGPQWLELLQPMPSAQSRIERLQGGFEAE